MNARRQIEYITRLSDVQRYISAEQLTGTYSRLSIYIYNVAIKVIKLLQHSEGDAYKVVHAQNNSLNCGSNRNKHTRIHICICGIVLLVTCIYITN